MREGSATITTHVTAVMGGKGGFFGKRQRRSKALKYQQDHTGVPAFPSKPQIERASTPSKTTGRKLDTPPPIAPLSPLPVLDKIDRSTGRSLLKRPLHAVMRQQQHLLKPFNLPNVTRGGQTTARVYFGNRKTGTNGRQRTARTGEHANYPRPLPVPVPPNPPPSPSPPRPLPCAQKPGPHNVSL